MSTAERHPAGFEVVVPEDGSLSADLLAQYGFHPGSHLRLVPEPESPTPHKTSRGVLEGKIDAKAMTSALRENKEERIAAIMGDDER